MRLLNDLFSALIIVQFVEQMAFEIIFQTNIIKIMNLSRSFRIVIMLVIFWPALDAQCAVRREISVISSSLIVH